MDCNKGYNNTGCDAMYNSDMMPNYNISQPVLFFVALCQVLGYDMFESC